MNEPYKPNEIERYILNSIKDIKFGSVEVIIHNAQIVQVEKSEKRRFEPQKTNA